MTKLVLKTGLVAAAVLEASASENSQSQTYPNGEPVFGPKQVAAMAELFETALQAAFNAVEVPETNKDEISELVTDAIAAVDFPEAQGGAFMTQEDINYIRGGYSPRTQVTKMIEIFERKIAKLAEEEKADVENSDAA